MARKQDWSPHPRPRPKAGDRVRLVDVVDRYPDALVHPGATGTIVEYDPPHIARVKLDLFHRGLAEWHNELHWYDFHLEAGEFEEAVEVLPPRRPVAG